MITNNDRCSQSEKSQDYSPPSPPSPQSPQREGNHNSTPVKPSQAKSPQANDRKQTQPWNNLGEKQLWDWLELLIAPGLIAVLTVVGSFGWNVISDRITAQRYREGLVKDYIEAVKVLLLDDYHKTGNNPEIRVEEVEAFVRSKTASTLRAINADGGDEGDPKQTTADWINFLKEAGITNAGWINFLKEAGIINAVGEDPKQTAVLINFLKKAGILKETGIEIEFFSSYNPINFLQEADWTNSLKEAGITNADLSDFLQEAGIIAGIINADEGDPKQTAVLINFLKEAGIGFISSDSANSRSEGIQTNKNQDICTEDVIALTKQPKNVIFSHFLCRIDLSGIKLNQSNLQSIILEDANLYRAELNDTQLFFADLERANLNEAQLQDANLSRANLRQAFLMSANLKDATLRGANLREADLSQRGSSPTNLSHAVLQGANLTKATLTNVDLSGADLSPMGLVEKAINLNPTNLRDANLENAKLNGTNLTMANLRGANLNQAIWDETTRFEQAIYDQYTCFPESFEFKDKKMRFIPSEWDKKREEKIQNCKNRRTPKHQETIDLKDADLRGADLREANLEHANLIGAKLRKADLRGANLEQAEFSPETCVINALYDQETQLPNSLDQKIIAAEMLKIGPGTDLSQPNPRGMARDLSGQDLTNTDLSNAKLQNVNLSNIEFDRWTKLDDASYDQDTRLPFPLAEARRRKMLYAPHLPSPSSTNEGEGKPVNWSRQNLEEGDFVQTDLTGANLSQTNLTKANFTEANLTKAQLQQADLTKANLQRANLTEANLQQADLREVDLRWANLTRADLTDAQLSEGVDLTELPGIKLCGTIMPDGMINNFSCQN